MILNEFSTYNAENVISSLCSLFEKYGYAQYKMKKFEEYDFYVKNKDYLASDNIITFTDTNGKLMALKPDVTLSIIKNSRDITDEIRKVYYTENVYRVSKSTNSFKEIMQTGIECFGAVDDYCVAETLGLAAKCLKTISDRCVLSVSNLDIVAYAVDSVAVKDEVKNEIMSLIGEKNLHQLKNLCEGEGISDEQYNLLSALSVLHGSPSYVFSQLEKILPGCFLISSFKNIICSLSPEIQAITDIDFSYTGDINYYNGVVFKGYIDGIPTGVISGGQYDRLMSRMGRKSKAVGFAVYLDALERLFFDNEEYDVDAVVVYDDGSDISLIVKTVDELTADGCRVLAVKSSPEKLKYRQIINLNDREAE